MSEYHQSYRDIKEMPLSLVLYLCELSSAKAKLTEDEIKNFKAQMENKVRIPTKPI